MRLRTTLALAVASLTIGVPAAMADPDGPYQAEPQVIAQPDALDRYLSNNAPNAQPDALDRYLSNNAPNAQPDALDRYLRNNSPQQSETTGAATHPDSRPVRPSLASDVVSSGGDGRDWATGAFGALGGALVAILAIVGASAIRERRRLVLR